MRKRGRPPHPDILTPREWQVLDLLRQDLTNEQIAQRLDISFATAKYHVAEIISKLGVDTREEAAAWQPEAARPRWAPLIARLPRRAWPLAGAAGALAVLGALALLLWPTAGSDQPEAVAQPSSTPTPRLAPKAPTTSPTTTSTPRPELPAPRSLTFQPNEGGRYFRGIYERTPDGLINLLVENPALFSNDQFSVSQDGRRVAIEYNDTLYRYERGGTEGPVPILSFPIMNKVVMSPDGDRALVTGYRYGAEGGEATYMVDMLSGSVTGFHPEGHKPFSAAWSPDGAWISFSERGGCDKQATYVVASDGTGLRKVADVSAESAWSPDGRRLALSAYCGGGVLLLDLDAGSIDLSVTVPSPSRAGPWSPDGRLLAFVAQGEIRVIDTKSSREWMVATGAEPTWSPDGSALAFLRDGNLYISNLDGSAQSQVTFPTQPFTDSPTWLPDSSLIFGFAPPFTTSVHVKDLRTGSDVDLADGRYPLWSPEGARIAFLTDSGSAGYLHAMGSNGEAIRKLAVQRSDDSGTPCEGQGISWSPDGQKIAYGDGVEARISLVNVAGDTSPIVVAAGYAPSWSVDGSLAYTSFGEQECVIKLLSLTTPAEETVLTNGYNPVWSPDGRHIALYRSGSGSFLQEIYVVAADGTAERQLTLPGSLTPGYSFSIGSWSPDGNLIALTGFPQTDSGDVVSNWQSQEIFLFDIRTGESSRLVSGSNPVWSPDGSQIAFLRWDPTNPTNDPYAVTPSIYLVDAAGSSEPRLLARGQDPSWSPDSSRIAYTHIPK